MSAKPNLLFVFSDQHRAASLGCYGNAEVVSPQFDRLAASGLRLNNYVSNCPVCVPIRPTMLTGLLPPHHGAVANDVGMKDGLESIAHVLNGAGYATGYIGKWHMDGVPRDKAIVPDRRLGFSFWRAYNCNHDYMHGYYDDEKNNRHKVEGYEPIAQTDMAIDFIKTQTQPWALYLSWGPPHDPYELVPEKYLNMFDENALTLPPNVPEQIARPAYVNGTVGSVLVDQATLRKYVRGYYAHIAALDEQMGRMLDTLEQLGLRENTIVIYTSDHGDMLGAAGCTGKQMPYTESYNVPFLLSWPKAIAPGIREQLCSHADISPSLLGLLGLGFSAPVDGKDLHEIFLSPDAPGDRDCLIADYIPAHNAAALGHEAWRGVVTPEYTYASLAYGPYVLFDRQNDPWELHNLIDDPAYEEVQQKLHELLLQRLQAQGDALEDAFSFIKHHHLTQAWNESQRHFGLPEAETGRLV